MTRSPHADWLDLATDSYWLWADSLMVMGMRTTGMMMGGPGSQREAVRMVTEKVQANAELAVALATGGPLTAQAAAHKAVKHYAKRVTANRKRLSRRK